MFCLIVGGISGISKLEINFNGNLNKLKESGGDLLTVRDELVAVDVTFWTVDDDLVAVDVDFETEDCDFDTEDCDFGTEDDELLMTEDDGFETKAGDFEAVDDDFVTDNDGGSFKIQDNIGSDSGWGNGLTELHRYFLGCVMACITWK